MEAAYSSSDTSSLESFSSSLAILSSNMTSPGDEADPTATSSSPTPSEGALGAGVRFRASHLQQWDRRYKELIEFRLEQGHCVVPLYYPANPTLFSLGEKVR